MPLTDCVMIKALKKLLCHFKKLLENSETFLSPLRWNLLKFPCTKKTPKSRNKTKLHIWKDILFFYKQKDICMCCEWPLSCPYCAIFLHTQVKCLQCQIVCYFREDLFLLFCLFSFWLQDLVQRYLFLLIPPHPQLEHFQEKVWLQ